jgi:hypothetical protein
MKINCFCCKGSRKTVLINLVANKKLRRESESLKGVNENLADILNSMNFDVVQLSDGNNFNSIEYLKKALEIVS